MKSKVEELYDYYFEKKLDMIFDSQNSDSVSSFIVEKISDIERWFSGYQRVENSLKCYNYCDLFGRLLLDEWYDNAEDFNYGYALVEKYFQKYGCVKKNIIDTNGKLISPEWFDEIKFEDDCIYGINSQSNDVRVLKQNYPPVTKPNYKVVEKNGKYNFKRIDGTFVLKEWADSLEDYVDGLALVCINGKYNLVDINGSFLSKDEWFDKIYGYRYMIQEGYATVYKDGKFNIMDPKGNLLIDWIKETKHITPFNYPTKHDIIPFVDLKEYKITNIKESYNEISNGVESYQIKGFPIRVYDEYILCCRHIGVDKEYPTFEYFLFNKKTKQYKKIGRNVVSEGFLGMGKGHYRCLAFDDNFIHDNYNHKVYFIYGSQIIDITDYYNRKLKGKRSVRVNKKLSNILSIDDFHYENLEVINQILREERERELSEQERHDDEISQENLMKKITEFEAEEKRRDETVRTTIKEIEERFQLLKELEASGAIIQIKYDDLYEKVYDGIKYHLEFKDDVIKDNRLHMFELSSETFENVKMDGIDFRKCNLDSICPTKVYKKNLRGCNFEGVHFGPFTSFVGVDIRGSKFGYDENNRTMDVMPHFNEAIFDETTTFNGIPLTELVKRSEKEEGLFEEENQARKINV